MKYSKNVPVYRGRYAGKDMYLVNGTNDKVSYRGDNISVGWVDYYIHPVTLREVVVAEFDMNDTTTCLKPCVRCFKRHIDDKHYVDGYYGIHTETEGIEYTASYTHTELYLDMCFGLKTIQRSSNVVASITIELDVPEGWIGLNDGKYIAPKLFFGKYRPNLLIINSIPELNWTDASTISYNLPRGDLSIVRGRFFTTKKGTNAFEIDANGPHVLIRDTWGGPFRDYRGRTLPDDELYYHRASSNGGGSGNDYAVVKHDWVYKPNINDY